MADFFFNRRPGVVRHWHTSPVDLVATTVPILVQTSGGGTGVGLRTPGP